MTNEKVVIKSLPFSKENDTTFIQIQSLNGVTNGDMIKAIFPQMNINEEWKATRHGDIVINGVTEVAISATTDWWNTPYKGVSE